MSNEEHDLEELIALAKKPLAAKEKKTFLSVAHQFAISCDIQEGTEQVKGAIIYDTYVQWNEAKEPQSKIPFLKDFGKIFTRKRTNRGSTYLINQTLTGININGQQETKKDIKK